MSTLVSCSTCSTVTLNAGVMARIRLDLNARRVLRSRDKDHTIREETLCGPDDASAQLSCACVLIPLGERLLQGRRPVVIRQNGENVPLDECADASKSCASEGGGARTDAHTKPSASKCSE